KAWAEWSRGKPITEKGVASLLHEYRIASRTVGPKGATAKGYRKADFEDAWKRYLAPQEEARPSGSEFLPSTRRPDGNHYNFAETSAVDLGSGRQEKNGYSPNHISAVDGSTGDNSETDFNDPGPIPDFLSRARTREVLPDR